MLPQITLESPLAQAVANAIQPKLVEMGWSDGSESPLIEYIVLMLVNGKTQEQIATELSNDFLGLDEGDTAALEFSHWLFGQVEQLNQQINGVPNNAAMGQPIPSSGGFDPSGQPIAQTSGEAYGQDAEMGDAANDSVPTGPKAMRNNTRGGKGRILNQINRNLDRGSDAALHRVRNTGNGRISHNNRGQRGGFNQHGRGGRMGMQGSMQMSPENQMQLMTMLEEQARMMSQLMPGFVPPAVNPAFQNGQNGQNGQGRSLFDRVERNGQRGGKRGFNKPRGTDSGDVDMEGQQDQSTPEGVCRFNTRCSRADCQLAHQSPAAPEGISIEPSDTCSYGAACKNKKCTGRHPSPAVRSAHQAEAMCRFFPNCTNPHCHFKHPSMPVCRNGSDCTAEGCKFTHIEIACKFNPCLNPSCHYKHVEGQRGSHSDKVWTPKSGGHVSERKFIADADGPEELIKPETAPEENTQGQEMTA
ncbi:unnamed protein product [Penicillium salamii]|uniref:Nab2-like CCCH zinc finger domain-containing protein n=1 Tax=Penicillium salamii TaxID=1612424 RepID=A0A9W4JTJ5_9EURO|nr:unnamed protein product [Penicillium salamii]CAG8355928.1 unnamed protein product [Penicillium salamii]CAG8420784.1 unnamed protein product [Penicillium salamii]